MTLHPLVSRLAGGDRRSLGDTDLVVEAVLAEPQLFEAVMEGLQSVDPIVCSRVAHVLERVSAARPELLQPHKAHLLGPVAEMSEWEVRTQLCLMLPRLHLAQSELEATMQLLQRYLDQDTRSFVRTFAMQALADLAVANPTLKAEVIPLIAHHTQHGKAAMQARGRKLLRKLELA
ncbi:MAG: hypothetical protein R3A44_02000 [Caldilineaceae bacterium]